MCPTRSQFFHTWKPWYGLIFDWERLWEMYIAQLVNFFHLSFLRWDISLWLFFCWFPLLFFAWECGRFSKKILETRNQTKSCSKGSSASNACLGNSSRSCVDFEHVRNIYKKMKDIKLCFQMSNIHHFKVLKLKYYLQILLNGFKFSIWIVHMVSAG